MTDTGHIADLKPDEHNPRQHNPRNIGMIEAALNDVGAARSIVVDEDNNILAGNGTIEAAASAGIERVRFVDADGDEIIAVRRRNLTDEQKRRLAYYDNRSAELADWHVAEIMADAESGALAHILWTDAEFEQLLRMSGMREEGMPAPGDADVSDTTALYGVVIECDDDEMQRDLLERMTEEGYRCRALIS